MLSKIGAELQGKQKSQKQININMAKPAEIIKQDYAMLTITASSSLTVGDFKISCGDFFAVLQLV